MPAPSDEPVPPIQVLDYARPERKRFFRRAVLFVMVVLLGAGIGMLIAWKVVPVHYVAEAMLSIRSSSFVPGAPQAGALQRYAAAFASPRNLDVAKRWAISLGITPQEWDQAIISADLRRDTNLIHISVEHPRAGVAMTVAKAVVEASAARVMLDGDVPDVGPPFSVGGPLPQRDRQLIAAGAVLGAVIAVWLRAAIGRRTLWRQA